MKPKALMLLAIAIGCGLVAMLGVQQAMQGSQKEVVIETRSVLTAVKDILPGEPLTEANVVMQELPVTALANYAEDLVVKPEEYQERALMISVVKGDPIRKSKVSEKGAYKASSQIPKGMRINTFPASDSQTHSGMLKPGDKVDVKVAFTGRKGIMEIKTLLEYVEVFACENKTVKSEDNKNEQRARFVTLLVTPEQDGYIELAKVKGQLSLSLRNPDDDELVNANGVDAKALEELQHSINKGDIPDYDQRYSGDEGASHSPSEVAAPVEPAPSPDASAGGVQGFLQGPAVASVAVPDTKKWKMTVYAGNDPVSVEVDDLPAEVKLPAELNNLQLEPKDGSLDANGLPQGTSGVKLDDNGLSVDANGVPSLNVDIKDVQTDPDDLQVEMDDIKLDTNAAPAVDGIPGLMKRLWSTDKN